MSNSKKHRRSQRHQKSNKGTREKTPNHASQSIPAKPVTQTETEKHFFDDKNRKLEYLEGLVTKQLDLYDWCEEKVSTLATIDAILLGGATLFIDEIKIVSEEQSIQITAKNIAMVTILTIPFFISLAITLWHIRPKMGNASTHAKRPNHRSSNGIRQFKTREAYKEHLDGMSLDVVCDDLANQIYGMNDNIWKNQKSIKKAVLFDLIGLVGFLLVIFYKAIFL